MSDCKRAVILAGGRGTRLKPYTVTLPKPLVPVGERAILEYLIVQLRDAGVVGITLAVNHMADLVMAYFGDGSKWGVSIDYSLETKPLSTIGPLTLIEDLPDDFFVMNGDILTDLPFNDLFDRHKAAGSSLTVATYRRIQQVDFGVLETNNAGAIVGFQEKPEYPFLVSMGVYVVARTLIEQLTRNEPYGFDQLVLDGMANGTPMNTYIHDGYWLDIGRPDDYEEANRSLAKLVQEMNE